jgi:2-haloacid dehalogenase
MNGFLQLVAWPDVKPALQHLSKLGIKFAFLSNATSEVLNAGIAHSQLDGLFDAVISTDRIRTYKPDPRAYQLGVDVLGVVKEEILFVAFAGWDVAGAKWFGYPTFWNNRQGVAREQLSAEADAVGVTLTDLVAYVTRRAESRG